MQRGIGVKTTFLTLIGALVLGAAPAVAQDPPSQPPASPPPAIVLPLAAPAPVEAKPLTEAEVQRRRDAIFIMEGVISQSVRLAANATQAEIQKREPDLKISIFSNAPPTAQGTDLAGYGVLFHVKIPTAIASIVGMIETLARSPLRPDGVEHASASRATPGTPIEADLLYVDTIRKYLTDAMVDHSNALGLRPNEWLTVSARGDDGEPGQVAPHTRVLRVKGKDLLDYLAGRLSREEVLKRVEAEGYPSR